MLSDKIQKDKVVIVHVSLLLVKSKTINQHLLSLETTAQSEKMSFDSLDMRLEC